MNREDVTLEDAMRELVPKRLDASLFGRLHAALDGASAPVDSVDATIEAMLTRHRPAPLPDALKHRLGDAIAPKVVAMPMRVIPFRRYAAAAAIALAGAAAALLAPIGDNQVVATTDTETPSAVIPLADARAFVPAGYARGLSEARDEGVVWKDNEPHRVLRIVYLDTITLHNEAGEIVEVEQPRVEYIVVPKKID
jgi:hypothetical protein